MTPEEFVRWMQGYVAGRIGVDRAVTEALSRVVLPTIPTDLVPAPKRDMSVKEWEDEQMRKLKAWDLECQRAKQMLPPLPPLNPVTPPRCSVCDLSFEGAMGYVCNRLDCPSAVRCGGTGE